MISCYGLEQFIWPTSHSQKLKVRISEKRETPQANQKTQFWTMWIEMHLKKCKTSLNVLRVFPARTRVMVHRWYQVMARRWMERSAAWCSLKRPQDSRCNRLAENRNACRPTKRFLSFFEIVLSRTILVQGDTLRHFRIYPLSACQDCTL